MFPANTKILVVDDMNMMRTMVKGELRKLGFTNVMDAPDGQRAFEILEEEAKKGSAIELILSDWNMPRMQGIELLKKVREHAQFAKLPFILITAEGESDQVKAAVALSVNSYLRKPFAPAVLAEKLKLVWDALTRKAA